MIEIFKTITGIDKWSHYLEIYERHFSKYRNEEITVLEIGVAKGGSLELWRKYFKKAKVYGIDIDPKCAGENVFIGSQSDKKFLYNVWLGIGDIDILIDDGSHRAKDQIATFEALYKHVDKVYLVEDLHTAYWNNYGGMGFIRRVKKLIDKLTAYHTGKEDTFTLSTDSMHFYDSVVVFEKGLHKKPYRI